MHWVGLDVAKRTFDAAVACPEQRATAETFKRLPVQPILHQVVDILVRRFRGGPQFAAHHVRDDGANGLAVFLLVGVEAREDGGFFVERQCRGAPPVGNPGVERVKAGAVGFTVRLQRLVDDGTGLEGVNRGAGRLAADKKGEQADIGSDIDHDGILGQMDAVPQVAPVLKDFLVDILRLVAVQVGDFDSVREDEARKISKTRRRLGRIRLQIIRAAVRGPVPQIQENHIVAVPVPAR